jgi:hypothetical protein
MEITANRFQAVIFAAPLNLENQIYNAALDSSPKNVWQSFLNWLNNLLNNDKKDQFDMVYLSKNINELVERLDPQFFDAIKLDQIQRGINNLQTLRTKFSKNQERGEEATDYLDLVIHKFEHILIDKHRKLEVIIKDRDAKLSEERFNKGIFDFFSRAQLKQAFEKNFPREAQRYNDSISYFGLEILKEVYVEHGSEAKINNPEHLLKMANIRKEALITHNQKTMKEIRTCFGDPQKILTLFFPAPSNDLPELQRQLNEGHLFFDIKHKNWLDEVIRNPESVRERLQTTPRNSSLPLIALRSNDLEQRSFQSELLKLRKV